jgi:hypothetical protein
VTLRERLESAVEGLVYSSESDRPFEFFALPVGTEGDPLSPSGFGRVLGVAPGTPIEERTLDAFLARHTHRSDAYDSRAQEIRPRYERLQSTLESALRDVRVFRLGRVEVACYIVGRDASGDLAGLRTVAVET